MCNHCFVFPEDKPENYHDGKKLTGKCKCGVTQKAYGLRWAIQRHDHFLEQVPYGKSRFDFLDKKIEIW
uniref:Uncharacterized protein n=1 Tax=viral metagenome TaxID=1070528 RepID=A0A6M3JVU4_9ZZZZ